MTLCVSAQVFSQSSWLPCLSSVSHSQPLDHVSSCSETRRIWAGKYSHMWQYIPTLSLKPLPPFFSLSPSLSPFLLLPFFSIVPFSLSTYLSSFRPFSLFLPSFCPFEVNCYFPKKKVSLRATFSKNDAVVSKPPWSGKHMFFCFALVGRKLVKSLIFSHVGDEVKRTRLDIQYTHAHTYTI